MGLVTQRAGTPRRMLHEPRDERPDESTPWHARPNNYSDPERVSQVQRDRTHVRSQRSWPIRRSTWPAPGERRGLLTCGDAIPAAVSVAARIPALRLVPATEGGHPGVSSRYVVHRGNDRLQGGTGDGYHIAMRPNISYYCPGQWGQRPLRGAARSCLTGQGPTGRQAMSHELSARWPGRFAIWPSTWP
jgi:hypothetical protein